MNLTDSADN